MFLVNWFYDTLRAWGLWEKEARLVFLGLDNAGKTTLLSVMSTNKLKASFPTRNPTSEEFHINNLTLHAFDLGGHSEGRKLWKGYIEAVDAIVFIIDAAEDDRSRRFETKYELNETLLIRDKKPVLILGNKIDKAGALSESEFRQEYDLFTTSGKSNEYLRTDGEGPIEVFMCSITNKEGYGVGFKWLSNHLE